jgi:hypothetical protein
MKGHRVSAFQPAHCSHDKLQNQKLADKIIERRADPVLYSLALDLRCRLHLRSVDGSQVVLISGKGLILDERISFYEVGFVERSECHCRVADGRGMKAASEDVVAGIRTVGNKFVNGTVHEKRKVLIIFIVGEQRGEDWRLAGIKLGWLWQERRCCGQ